jgi:hypothetical protein
MWNRRRSIRSVSVCALLALAVACGGSPPGPSSGSNATGGGIPFQATRYSLQIVGDSGRCGDLKTPRAGTVVSLRVTMQPDATGWAATPENTSNGALSFHFIPGVVQVAEGHTSLAGTARGFADDAGISIGGQPAVPNGTRATLGTGTEAVPHTGLLVLDIAANGTFDGTVTFSRDGVTSTCPAGAVTWQLSRFF